MSIIVKGMEMPTSCFVCDFANFLSTGEPYCKRFMRPCSLNGERPNWCPIGEIQTPHGRLVDADAFREGLREGFTDEAFCLSMLGKHEDVKRVVKVVLSVLGEQPTIIEEEE